MDKFLSKIPPSYAIPSFTFAAGILLGRLLVPASAPRSSVCGPDIQALRECQQTLSGHQQRCASAVAEASDSCVEAQTVVCDQKIEELGVAVNEINCAICEARR